MENYKKLYRDSTLTAITVLAQDYISYDSEFANNLTIKRNIDNPCFWADVSQAIQNKISEILKKSREDECEFDECDDVATSDLMVYNYVLTPKNRFALNDIICDAISDWLSIR